MVCLLIDKTKGNQSWLDCKRNKKDKMSCEKLKKIDSKESYSRCSPCKMVLLPSPNDQNCFGNGSIGTTSFPSSHRTYPSCSIPKRACPGRFGQQPSSKVRTLSLDRTWFKRLVVVVESTWIKIFALIGSLLETHQPVFWRLCSRWTT